MPEVAKGPVIKLGVLLGPLLLVGLVFTACSSPPPTPSSRPTILPAHIETPTSVPTPTPSSTAPATQDAHMGETTGFASIEASPESGNLPLRVSFEAVDLAHAMFGPVTGYRWDFGDGDLGEGIAAEHSYTSAGSYTVVLTILYKDGTRSVAETAVQVGAAVTTATSEPPPVSTPVTQDRTTTPSPTPTLTPVSTSTTAPPPTAIPVPAAPLPVDLEGLEISSEGKVIKVSLVGLTEAVADQVESLPEVTKVERYLKVATPDYPDPFIGVEPGSALRIGVTIVTLAVGEDFQSRDERVAIPGFSLNSNPYTGMGGMAGMAGMAHRFMTGQTFVAKGIRLRVIDLFRASDTSLEKAILIPLGTAQELFGFHGELTTIFVTVNEKEKVDKVAAEIKEILGAK